MASAIQKITSLGERRDIPFNRLVLSAANVRKVEDGLSIDQLAEDIARRGLLKNLNVRPVVDGEGQETGMFEVPAGGRRFRALEQLVKAKRLARTAPIPCSVRPPDSAISAEEDSLAENVQVVALHPLDQFRAFKAMVDQGASETDVAARFFVTAAVVRQRLRLASVAPALLDAYADGQLSLDELMAFTVTTDQARQLQVWEAVSRDTFRSTHAIRRHLTQGAVSARDRRVQFIGIEAYVEAGGMILRDLFSNDDGGWLEDAGLVDLLATEKLRDAAQELAGEGWKWIEIGIDFPYGHTNGLRALAGVRPRLSDEEQATRDALVEQLDALYAEHEGDEDLPEAVDGRLAELETAIDGFDGRPTLYDAEDVARAGAFLSIDGNGNLRVERGFVRPEDEAPASPGEDAPSDAAGDGTPDGRAFAVIGGQDEPPASEADQEALKPLSERLLGELTAHRTLALRNAVAIAPHVALTLLLHRLVIDTFLHGSAGTCLDASVRHVFFPVQGAELKDSSSAAAVQARHASWLERLPADEQALWDWLAALDQEERLALLAHCVSYGVNALFEKVDRFVGSGMSQSSLDRRLRQADRLAAAVDLDMVAAGWRPTVDTYLGKVTKPRILGAVREACGEHAAQLIDHLRKGDMAKEAERLLSGRGWLPEVLRTPVAGAKTDPVAGEPLSPLPAFLSAADPGLAGEPGGDVVLAAE